MAKDTYVEAKRQINNSIVDRHIRADYGEEDSQKILLLDDGYWNRAKNFVRKNITQRSTFEEKPNYVERAVNHKHKLDSGNVLNVIVEKNLTKDTTIAYYTTANNILELQKYGMTKSEALTAQLIETVGAYRLGVVKRAIDSGIQTTKTDLKLMIVDTLNERVKLLQPIERLINTDRENFDGAAFFDYIKNLREHRNFYSSLIDRKKSDFNSLPDEIKKFLQYDPDYLEEMKKNISRELENANKLASKLFAYTTEPYVLNPRISDDERNSLLMNYIRKRLDRIAMDAREQNQQITQGSLDSTFRGKLDQALSNAIVLTTSYTFDQHNPITKEHQSDYKNSDSDGTNKLIYNSRQNIGLSKSGLEDLLKVIVTVENGGVTNLLDNNQRDEKNRLKTVSSAGWRAPSFKKRDDLFSKQYRNLKRNIGSVNAFFRGIINGAKEIGGFVALVLPTVWDNFKSQALHIRDDYTKHSKWPTIMRKLGLMKEKPPEQTAPVIIDEKLQAFITEAKKDAFEKNPIIRDHSLDKGSLTFAIPKSHLHAYKPDDFFTDVVGSIGGIIDFVKDDLADKHPVTFLAIALAYVGGAATFVTPVQFKAILAKLGLKKPTIDKVMSTLKSAATYETHGNAFEVGTTWAFTEAKFIGLVTNLSIEGAEGWLPKFVANVAKNPAAVIAAVGAAYGIGLGINYGNIPGLTNTLKDSEGRGAWIEEMVVGGKLAAVSGEMLLPSHGAKSRLAEYLGTALKFALTLVRAIVSIPALSTQPWKELGTMLKNGGASLAYNLDFLARKIFQVLKAAPKLLVDSGVMMISTLAKLQKPFKAIASLFSKPETVNTKSSGLGKLYRAQKKGYNAADYIARGISDEMSRSAMNKLGKAMTQKHEARSSDEKILEQLNAKSDWVEKNIHQEKSFEQNVNPQTRKLGGDGLDGSDKTASAIHKSEEKQDAKVDEHQPESHPPKPTTANTGLEAEQGDKTADHEEESGDDSFRLK